MSAWSSRGAGALDRAPGWLPAVRREVYRAKPYIGWSAGANLALNRGVAVLGLREGSLLRREGGRLELRLGPGAKLFSGSNRKKNVKAGSDLSFLLR